MRPVKIFVVDDDKIFVFLTRKIIESTNEPTEVTVFGNGSEALQFIKTSAESEELLPDIIFLDLSMPVMDGWDFLEEYMLIEPQIKKKIALYLVSSTISPHDIERAKSIRAVSEFFIKPLTKDKFTDLIKNF